MAKHREFIARQIIQMNESPTRIRNMLADPRVAEDNGFAPVEITAQGVFLHIQRLKRKHPEEIDQQRQLFLSNIAMIPLANKAVRILELQKMYESLMRKKDRGQKVTESQLLAILNAIRLEQTDETLGKLADAMLAAPRAYFNPATIPPKELEIMRGNAVQFYTTTESAN